MTKFETLMEEAQNAEKVTYYDYLSYKRACGWYTGLINDDWHRPAVIKKAKYNSMLLQKLPEYYFLGFPIRELLKSNYSEGYCHACVVALSLYFEEFSLITCNLKNYEEHYFVKSGKQTEYEHTFLLFYHDNKQKVIDTTFGLITDLKTYTKIFNPTNLRTITSRQLGETKPYQFIKSLKEYSGPPLKLNEILNRETGEWEPIPEEVEYRKILKDYMEACKDFIALKNPHLTDFITRCLYKTSNSRCHWNWRNTLEFQDIGNNKYVYPEVNLSSLEDDEFDNNLYSLYDDTIERNKKVLIDYHSSKEKQTSVKMSTTDTLKCKLDQGEVQSDFHMDEINQSTKSSHQKYKLLTLLKKTTRK